jgi:hypothetical protein
METPNPSMEKKTTSTFQVERVQNFIPFTNNTKGPNQGCQNQCDVPILCWVSHWHLS